MTEPLQPGDEQEAENGAPPPIPDPPDTDPIPEDPTADPAAGEMPEFEHNDEANP